jgi:hypothetical protein
MSEKTAAPPSPGGVPPLDEDWPAIAAHAAHHDIVAPAEALASWRALSEDRRVAWRASADAVRMLLDGTPSPELAAAMAETRRYRDAIAALAAADGAAAVKAETAAGKLADGVERLLLARSAATLRGHAAQLRALLDGAP